MGIFLRFSSCTDGADSRNASFHEKIKFITMLTVLKLSVLTDILDVFNYQSIPIMIFLLIEQKHYNYSYFPASTKNLTIKPYNIITNSKVILAAIMYVLKSIHTGKCIYL